jgi:hypothetical protein
MRSISYTSASTAKLRMWLLFISFSSGTTCEASPTSFAVRGKAESFWAAARAAHLLVSAARGFKTNG